jgi:RHS repeat-associated protein
MTSYTYDEFTTEEYGDLISQYDGADTLYHQYDGLGSTDALLDEWETATDRYAHRAFGLEAARSGTTDNPFTYVGRQSYYKDPELELYLLGARYYDPALGRFLSQDPIGFEAGDANFYRYVENSPTNATDPSGYEKPRPVELVDIMRPVQPELTLDNLARQPIGHSGLPDLRVFTEPVPAMSFANRNRVDPFEPFGSDFASPPFASNRMRMLSDHCYARYLFKDSLAGVIWIMPFKNESGAAVSLRLFSPNATRSKWVQIVKSTTNGTTNYQFGVPGGLYTRFNKEKESEHGYAIDVFYSDPRGLAPPPSNIYYEDHHRESDGGFPACLIDYPQQSFITSRFKQTEFYYESYLVDPDNPRVFGGIRWGFTVERTDRELRLFPMEPELLMEPSGTFKEAVENANTVWKKDYTFWR